MPVKEGYLVFSEEVFQKIARERLDGMTLVDLVLLQAKAESKLKFLRGVNFRRSENSAATRAYTMMSVPEFEGINGRQRWANWRTIPRNLNGRIPDRALRALDLCCGVGHSTEVLACYLPVGSTIQGIEYNPEFVRKANAREARYRRYTGEPISTRFVEGSVLETFRDDHGEVIAANSVDLINCCGAVGVHFKPEATRRMATECARVLRPDGGIAMIDSSPFGTSARELTRIFEGLGFERVNSVRSCFADYAVQLCFRKK